MAIPSTGKVVDINPQSLALANNASVGSFTDDAGRNWIISTNAPVYKTNVKNGKAAFDFTTAGATRIETQTTLDLSVTDKISVFVVLKDRSTGITVISEHGANSNTNVGVNVYSKGDGRLDAGVTHGGTYCNVQTGYVYKSDFRLLGILGDRSRTTANALVYTDNVPETVYTSNNDGAGNFGNFKYYIGGRADNTYYADFQLLRYVIYNREVTNSERLQIEEEFNTLYGLTFAAPLQADSFNRPNAPTLGADYTDIGYGQLNAPPHPFSIVNKKAYLDASNSNRVTRTNYLTTDSYSKFRIEHLGNTPNGVCIVARLKADGSGYYGYFSGVSSYLGRFGAGASSFIHLFDINAGYVPQVGDEIMFSAVGNVLSMKLHRNGVLSTLATVNNNDITGVGANGLFPSVSNWTIDDYIISPNPLSEVSFELPSSITIGQTAQAVNRTYNFQTGFTYQWKLNGLNYSTAYNPPAFTGLSAGSHTIELVCTPIGGGTPISYSKSLFVGQVLGANNVAKNTDSVITTNIPNAVFSTNLGTINSTTGLFNSNVAGTATITAERAKAIDSTGSNAASVNPVTGAITIVNYIESFHAWFTPRLTKIGDRVEFPYRVANARSSFFLLNKLTTEDGTGGYFAGYIGLNGYNFPVLSGVSEGDIIAYEILPDLKVGVYVNNVLAGKSFTTVNLQNNYSLVVAPYFYGANGTVFDFPTFSGDGIIFNEKATKQVNVYEAAVANFTLPETISINQSFTPNNTSTGATDYEWDVNNDGTIDFETAAPSIQFNSFGEKQIRLRAFNGYTSDEIVKTIFVTLPQLAASYSPNFNLIAPVKIQFTDISPNTPTENRWYFGDYAESNELNPAHTYLAPGVYEIKRYGNINGVVDDDSFFITIGGNPAAASEDGLVFDEIELPRYYTEGASGGPEFSTSVLGNPQGRQQRNSNRYDAIHKYEINFEGEEYEGKDFKELLDFFYTRYGAGIGFRFFPHYDNQWNDERIATLSSAKAVYPLIRTYKKAGRDYIRRIVKPVPEIEVRINDFDADYYSDYTVDYINGRITFATPANLPNGGALRVTGEYCIPVVFSVDKLNAKGYSSYADLEGLQVVELLPKALGISD